MPRSSPEPLSRRERVTHAVFALGNRACVEEIRGRLTDQYCLRVFFGSSRRQLVSALLQEDAWSDEGLEDLDQAIALVRKERGRP